VTVTVTVQDAWTIAELSARVGMSVRNIRAHQSRGMVPPPVRRGRVAYYGPRHEQALGRIRELQRKGYNLIAVAKLLHDDGHRDSALTRTVLAPLLEGEEVALTQAQIAGMFGVTPSAERLRTALDAGLMRELGDGRYAVPSRQLLNATLALAEQGLSIVDVYPLQVEITEATRDVALRFVEACLNCALPPEGEVSADAHERARLRFEELRNQFTVVLAATFAVNVRRATETLVELSGS
jgi:DNA-binding transcriptional MerR regulator